MPPPTWHPVWLMKPPRLALREPRFGPPKTWLLPDERTPASILVWPLGLVTLQCWLLSSSCHLRALALVYKGLGTGVSGERGPIVSDED